MKRLQAKIIREKCAFLLNELLEDISVISDGQSLDVPPFTNTRSLKRFIIDKFEEHISFFPLGKYLLVHASEMNLSEYTLAILHASEMNPSEYTLAILHASEMNPSEYTLAILHASEMNPSEYTLCNTSCFGDEPI